MPDKGKRVMKKKFVRTPSGKSKKIYTNEKHSQPSCALTGEKIQGVRAKHNAKMSKSQKKVSAPFGGQLSGTARKIVIIERIKVKEGLKQKEDIELKLRKYVTGE